MLTIYTNHPGGNLVHRYKTIENFQRDYNVHCLLPKIWHNRCLRFLLGRLWLRGEKLETMVMKNWGRRGGHTMCIIMVSVKMVNKISRSLRTNCYKLYPNRLNRLNRVQKLLRLKSSLKNDTNNRNVQFSQVNCKLERFSTLSVSLFDTLNSKRK